MASTTPCLMPSCTYIPPRPPAMGCPTRQPLSNLSTCSFHLRSGPGAGRGWRAAERVWLGRVGRVGKRGRTSGDTLFPAAPGWPLARSPIPGHCRASMRQSPRVGWAGAAPRWLPAALRAPHSHHSLAEPPGQEAGTSPPSLSTQVHLPLPAVCKGRGGS